MEPESESSQRRVQLATALAILRRRIATACAVAQRDPATVELLAVTKTFPVRDIALLYELGLRMFGESKVQEAQRKVAEFTASASWHMVGQLQTNKTRSVARWADRVHSVDSIRLVTALDKAVSRTLDDGERTTPLEVLVQVNLDTPTAFSDINRGGAAPYDVLFIADKIVQTHNLELRGLMAIAPLHNTGTEKARDIARNTMFGRLASIAEQLRTRFPTATELSAGMSGDLETAIKHGSTCVRVGTALLADRRLTSQ